MVDLSKTTDTAIKAAVAFFAIDKAVDIIRGPKKKKKRKKSDNPFF